MLEEALDSLAGTFKKATEARKLDLPGDGRKVFVDQGGTLTAHDIPPACRAHKVDSVEDLIAAATRWNSKPVVWISGEAVVLLTNDDDRRDTRNIHHAEIRVTYRLGGSGFGRRQHNLSAR